MPSISAYVCEPCGLFMRIEKNSVTVEEQLEDGQPYKLWSGDRYRCPGCGHQIISGFRLGPIDEHFTPTYARTRERFAPIVEAK